MNSWGRPEMGQFSVGLFRKWRSREHNFLFRLRRHPKILNAMGFSTLKDPPARIPSKNRIDLFCLVGEKIRHHSNFIERHFWMKHHQQMVWIERKHDCTRQANTSTRPILTQRSAYESYGFVACDKFSTRVTNHPTTSGQKTPSFLTHVCSEPYKHCLRSSNFNRPVIQNIERISDLSDVGCTRWLTPLLQHLPYGLVRHRCQEKLRRFA